MLIHEHFLWSKEIDLFTLKKFFFETTQLSLIQRNFFFDRISKKCFFDSKKLFSVSTLLTNTQTKIYLISLSLNEDNYFFKLKKIFLLVTLRMLYATAQIFIFLIQRKKKLENFFCIKETFLLPYRNAQIRSIQKNFVWIKETFFWLKRAVFLESNHWYTEKTVLSNQQKFFVSI